MKLQAGVGGRLQAIQFHLECVCVSLMYFDHRSAQQHLQTAQELSGLDVSMTGTSTSTAEEGDGGAPPAAHLGVCSHEGALGKRTHFQQKFLAQLVIQVQRKDEQSRRTHEDSPTCTPPCMLPKVTRPASSSLSVDVFDRCQ